MFKRVIGQRAEKDAQAYLQRQGLQMIESNYNTPIGEIDLIMQHKDTLVFVEVRKRTSAEYGSALDSIDQHKQRKIIRTAQHYLQRNALDCPCRIDVVVYDGNKHVQWLQNAIDAN